MAFSICKRFRLFPFRSSTRQGKIHPDRLHITRSLFDQRWRPVSLSTRRSVFISFDRFLPTMPFDDPADSGAMGLKSLPAETAAFSPFSLSPSHLCMLLQQMSFEGRVTARRRMAT